MRNLMNCSHFCYKYILIWCIFQLLSYDFVLCDTHEPKCKLVPPKGKVVLEANQRIQEGFLNFLKTHGLYGEKFSYEVKKEQLVYDLIICDDVTSDKPNASIVRKVTAEGSDSTTAIGMRNATQVAGEKGKWIMLTFGPGEVDKENPSCQKTNLSSSVMFVCDRKYSKGEFRLLYEDRAYCRFVFEVRTAALCGPAPGMSGWSVLFILILVGLSCYFLIGFLYLRIHAGAKGIDQLPNRTFWFALGNKISDGCGAVCRCDQYCSDPVEQLDTHSPYSDGGYSPLMGGTPATISPHMERDATLINP